MSDTKKKSPSAKIDFFADLKARAGNAQKLAAGIESEIEVSERIDFVSVSSISPNPDQPRRAATPKEDAELLEDVKKRGILQPIIVRPLPGKGGEYQLVAGERRWRAARAANLETIPTIIKNYDDKEARTVAAIENLQRKDLEPSDEAQYFKFLAEEYNLSNREIANLISKSASYVDQRMRLLDSNRVKNTQKLQTSQVSWKYRPKEWEKIKTAVSLANEGYKAASPRDKEELKQSIRQLKEELTALEKKLSN